MKLLTRIEDHIISFILLLSIFLGFFNVVLRQFGIGISWTEELIRYLIIWMTFLGVSVGIRDSSHISIDALPMMLKNKPKKILNGVIYVIGIVINILFVYYSYLFIQTIYSSNQVSPALGVDMYYFYLVLLIAGAFSTLMYIVKLYQLIFK